MFAAVMLATVAMVVTDAEPTAVPSAMPSCQAGYYGTGGPDCYAW